LPKRYKAYSKTKPIQLCEFDDLKQWWNKREESEQAWKVNFQAIIEDDYNLDIKSHFHLPISFLEDKKELKENIPFIGEKMQESRKKGIASAYRLWINKIQQASNDLLANKLKDYNMVIDKNIFTRHIKDEKPYNLISIGDFNSLIALSQKHSKPIFELTEEEINQSGKSLEEMKDNQQLFKDLFNKLAQKGTLKMNSFLLNLVFSKKE